MPNQGPTGGSPNVPVTVFSARRIVLIGAAFGSLVIVADVYDEKTALWIGASLFAIMLFTTDMGTYLSEQIKNISKRAVRG